MSQYLTTQEKNNAIAQRLSSDKYAPRYHFIAPEGNALPFDPNGVLFWMGKYHLFYIFQDSTLPHGGHCWGHASSSDLLHWDYHPTALAPVEGDPDKGIFSGNAFISKEGIPTLAYYGIDAGICLAQSTDDDLISWTKLDENPVIPEPQAGEPGWDVYNVFDPHIWLDGDTYYAILGGNIKPHQLFDTAYLFQSDDLLRWQYLRPFYSPHPDWTEPIEDCACPDFFELNNRHVLVCISHSHGARYYLGRFQDGTFIPEEHHRMNWPGGPCFAPETLVDGQHRRIFWAWALDQRKGERIVKNELGVMTLPRVLALDMDGHLTIKPPQEFMELRENNRSLNSLTITPTQDFFLDDIQGKCLEISIEALVPVDSKFGVKVLTSTDCEEQTLIIVDTTSHTLSIDTSRSSLGTDIYQPFPLMRGKTRRDVRIQTAPFKLEPDESVELRIFIDRSILEVFANGRQCITQRIYPTKPDSQHLALFSQCENVAVHSINIWNIRAIYPPESGTNS